MPKKCLISLKSSYPCKYKLKESEKGSWRIAGQQAFVISSHSILRAAFFEPFFFEYLVTIFLHQSMFLIGWTRIII